MSDHKRGEGNRTTNSLYARHFIEDNHKFVNPLEEYEIVKVVNNTVERKLREELEISVSYTHLDVYKRQFQDPAQSLISAKELWTLQRKSTWQ